MACAPLEIIVPSGGDFVQSLSFEGDGVGAENLFCCPPNYEIWRGRRGTLYIYSMTAYCYFWGLCALSFTNEKCNEMRWISIINKLFFYINISQGSVATCLRCGGIFNKCCIADFLEIKIVKEFLKSANIWRSYVYSVSQKNPPLRICGNISKTAGNFSTKSYMPIVHSYLR